MLILASAALSEQLESTKSRKKFLIKELVATISDDSIKGYGRALLFYSDKLDQKFD